MFLVTPADTRIVYAAQGEAFDAVVADMERPPRMDADTHWLACYVMISRATTLEGFLVLRPALLKELMGSSTRCRPMSTLHTPAMRGGSGLRWHCDSTGCDRDHHWLAQPAVARYGQPITGSTAHQRLPGPDPTRTTL